jgi:hypothetical protein
VDWSNWVDTTIHVVPPADNAGNTFLTARAVTPEASTLSFHDWVGAADPVDYYSFTLSQDEFLDLGLSTTIGGSGPTIQAALFASDGTPINTGAIGANSTSAANVSVQLSAGNYVLGVTPNGGATGYYDLSLGTHVAPPADNAGNNFASARVVTLTSTPQTFHDWLGTAQPAPDVVDYYSFTAAGPETVHVQLADNTQSITVAPFTLAGPGSMTGGGTAQAGGQSMDFSVPVSGTYALQLINTQPGTYYNLTLSSS